MVQVGLSPLLLELKQITLVGTGLIGASVAAALRAQGYAGRMVGCARTTETLDRALELGLIDSGSCNVAEAVEDADLVLLAVPMLAMPALLQQIAPALKPSCIVTDAGSVKGSFVKAAESAFRTLEQVVPAHPVAGKEFSGVDAADASLYFGHLVILTPPAEANQQAIETVGALWRECGARVEILDWQMHDKVLAATSHLPHVVAFTVVDMLSRHESREQVFKYSAGGFRDFTRIASGDPEMWRDICLSNCDEISAILGELIESLKDTRELVQQQDGKALEAIFSNSKTTRDALIEKYALAQAAQRDAKKRSN